MSPSRVSVPCPFDPEVVNRVRYSCTCGMHQPLSKLYFCRHCLSQRCGYCVSHEVDSHYCPNCLENMPSAEARLKKNRCANCFDCPSCGHTLSTRATSMAVPSAEDPAKMVAKKVYYLACAFCRWTSRDIGLPDQNVASGGWPDRENPEAARLAALQDHFRSLAQKEKIEKESRRFLGRKLSYMQLSDKYGVTAAVARKRAGLPPLPSFGSPLSANREESGQAPALKPSEAVDIEEVEVLDEAIFEQEVMLNGVTTLGQRLAQVDTQPEQLAKIYPRHKHLLIKRSQRCRKCEHNLSKPEYNPSSIKFKIQLAAYYHVPEVIIFKVMDDLKAGGEVHFVLKVVNPTQHPTKVAIVNYTAAPVTSKEAEKKDEVKESGDKKEEEKAEEKEKKPAAATGLGLLRNTVPIKASERHVLKPNAITVIPQGTIYVPPRDDAAEFDDAGPDLKGVEDDKNLIAWRKSNKVGVKLKAKIAADLEKDAEVKATFGLKFIYTNTISALEQREVQTKDIVIPVTVNLGKAA